MNWISKFIKPKIKSLFEKQSSKTDENLWATCGCKNLIYREDLKSNLKVCPKCNAVWEGVHWRSEYLIEYYHEIPRYGKKKKSCPKCADK